MAIRFSAAAWMSRDLSEIAQSLGRWWLGEFLALFPPRMAEWLIGEGRRSLVVSADQDAVEMRLLTDGHRLLGSARIELAAYVPTSIDDFLRSHALDRTKVALCVRLAPDKFFQRTLLLPTATLRSLDKVVVQDLLGKTPFRLDDVFHGYAAKRAPGVDQIVVTQWIVRRAFVQDATFALGLDLEQLSSVTTDVAEAASKPIIKLHSDGPARKSALRRLTWGLSLSALLLGLAAACLTWWRQQMLLDDLDAQVEAARGKASHVRLMIDKIEQRQAMVAQLRWKKIHTAGLLDVLDEVTRVLPAHSWLTELRLAEMSDGRGRQIIMTGLSAAASSLVGLFDQSPLFTGATLTAPVTLDAVEGRERFALQARIRPEPLRSAAR